MDVVDILREGVGVALKLGAPLLLLSMLAAYISNQSPSAPNVRSWTR